MSSSEGTASCTRERLRAASKERTVSFGLHGRCRRQFLADPSMNRSYRLYSRIGAIAFIVLTVYVPAVDAVRHHQDHDWFHDVLHLMSAVCAAYAGLVAVSIVPARFFTWGIGLFYFALGTYGWFTPGLLMNTPLAISLSAGDNIVHLLLAVPALVIMVRHLLKSVRPKAVPVDQTGV